MTTEEWLRLRSCINHDWLKNGFMPALSAAQNTIRGLVRNPEFGRTSLMNIISDWHSYDVEIGLLVRSAECALSPAGLFEAEPLRRAQFTPGFRQQTVEFVHHLWKRRTGFDGQIARATTALKDARACTIALEGAIDTSREMEAVGGLLKAVRELSAALSALPQRVEIL